MQKTIHKTILSIKNADKTSVVELSWFYVPRHHKSAASFKCSRCGKERITEGLAVSNFKSDPNGAAEYQGIRYSLKDHIIFCEDCLKGKHMDGFDQDGVPCFYIDTKEPLDVRLEEGL